MVVSKKQQAANRRNAQHSTGPKTPEGKAAVRFNALTWSLRARSLMLPGDNPADYQQLWDELADEWQPQTRSERYYLEQMCISQWLLTRTAESEHRIRRGGLPLVTEMGLLSRVSGDRVRLERSFTAGLRELERLQLKRAAQQSAAQRQGPQPKQTTSPAKAAPAPDRPPAYVMSECAPTANPVSCAPANPDTR
jgi:hypothetical protein